MKFLVIGLGSMGKRRIRCLSRLGFTEIFGFDLKENRAVEAKEKYSITIVKEISQSLLAKVDALFISTPPNRHNEYIQLAIENKKPAFVEASVMLQGLKELCVQAEKAKVLIAPSCTMRFHPAIREIKKIVNSGALGKITNFSYHCGNFLPDWHPWENVKNFYVGQKEVGGAREMVPFELTWIVDTIGFPKKVSGFFGKTMNVGADVMDTYSISLDFGNFFGSMIIDVVSRNAIRNLTLNLERGQILWNWENDFITVFDAEKKESKNHYFEKGKAEKGYNENIEEEMYVAETKQFVSTVENKTGFSNSLEKDIEILEILEKIEGKK